ncbi:MAG: thioredoxin domain-containing protein [Spartobacteria bacterium]|nr:thioredoxin domain-containing protein [Spartobacteria bacterium]
MDKDQGKERRREGVTHAGDHANRLLHEKSPYLLQHAHNPVDWYPWGEEAFAKARREDKPIFLSVGYSTCHWCHVMEHESFENDRVAGMLNAHFVCIKVDREERPDVDRVYMAYVQATTGSGGWPMSIWLTPDLKPFFGGTYFPPEDKWGRSGFMSVLRHIADAWEADRERILSLADDSLKRLRQATAPAPAAAMPLESQVFDLALKQARNSYDPRYGGFGGAPKFPRPSLPDFLLRYYAHTGNEEALAMTLHTLRAMAAGGMYDQLGGGFHRYSVDERWHVPHFEKMLYDQAQLVCTYLDAFQLTREPVFARTAKETLGYVLRDLTGPEGQFFSAEDADSPVPGQVGVRGEGAFYVWEKDEALQSLGEESAAVFSYHYGVAEDGNVRNDPQGEFTGKNILYAAHGVEETADAFDLAPERVERMLRDARVTRLKARSGRPRPHRDDKAITAWNGLMISAFARAFQVFGDETALHAANRAADFIRRRLYDETTGTLRRRYRDGEAAIDGYADDYAYLIRGLLDLYEAGFDVRRLEWATVLQARQDELFLDTEHGGYFNTSGADPAVLLRIKDDYDGAEPSVNSVAAHNLLRLFWMTENEEYARRAESVLAAFSPIITRAPQAMPSMLVALGLQMNPPKQIVLAGTPGAADTLAMLRAVHARFIPGKVLLFADATDGPGANAPCAPLLKGRTAFDGKATLYICEDFTCRVPITDPEQAAEALGSPRPV